MKQYELTRGFVRPELNEALRVLSRIMPEFFAGFVADYVFYFINESRTIARAVVSFNDAHEVVVAFKQEYPIPAEILDIKAKFFSGKAAGEEYLRDLQRLAGPICWKFELFETTFKTADKSDMGHFSFRLKASHIALLCAAADDREGGIASPAWDAPDHFSNLVRII